VALTAALRLVEASSATAMSYLTVVWGLILGYFFFSEVICPFAVHDLARLGLSCRLLIHSLTDLLTH